MATNLFGEPTVPSRPRSPLRPAPPATQTLTPPEPPDPEAPAPAKREAGVVVPHRRGAAFSILESGEKEGKPLMPLIRFTDGGVGGGMSNAIAKIRYWSRISVQQKTPTQAPAEQSPLTPTTPANFTPPPGAPPVPILPPPAQATPTPAPTPTVPVNPYNTPLPLANFSSNVSLFDAGRFVNLPPNLLTTPLSNPVPGNFFSANPNGQTNGSEPTPSPTDAVWQFLFNPEELTLESGPDYNRAETWAVSEPENSGSPLSWRGNKNRKLIFSKVLLHGYTFGKRVERLEKGIQDLFMARDGENGADGPPVLEFVWGERVFGPCVIQNIRVKESAWDNGLLVNAEVSFDLEQIPEWTINDGFVDILRPGRQPTISDPRDNTNSATPPPGTTTAAPAPSASSASATSASNRLCQDAFKYAGIFKQLQIKIVSSQTVRPSTSDLNNLDRLVFSYGRALGELSSLSGGTIINQDEATKLIKEYDELKKKNVNFITLTQFLISDTKSKFDRARSFFKDKNKCPNITTDITSAPTNNQKTPKTGRKIEGVSNPDFGF